MKKMEERERENLNWPNNIDKQSKLDEFEILFNLRVKSTIEMSKRS